MKPANILVGDGDRAYLSDFGVVKEVAEVGTTRTGSFVGTIEYCAPEQIEGKDVDARADVYALACVLYECLVGTPPFHRSSDVAILNAHLHAPPPKLSKAAPDLPAGARAGAREGALEVAARPLRELRRARRGGACGRPPGAARVARAARGLACRARGSPRWSARVVALAIDQLRASSSAAPPCRRP